MYKGLTAVLNNILACLLLCFRYLQFSVAFIVNVFNNFVTFHECV